MSKRKIPIVGHVTRGSVFDDPALFDPSRAAELKMRAELLRGLERWLKNSGQTQTEAAKVLGVTQARISEIKHGKISTFSLDLLVRLAARAGLDPKVKLAA
jgi:predicted XRE-type DNA-binding protein